MKLHTVLLERFRSFKKPTRFVLPKPGLVFVAGENGHGKSTLFESLHWCLFGKTSRNLKAGNVANWLKPKDCSVQIEGEAFGKRIIVKRTWNPNVLLLNNKEVDQETLETELGISLATYTYAYHFPQFGIPFLDLRPEQKMALLVDVLKLHVWESASDLASEESQKLCYGIAKDEGGLSEAQAMVNQFDLESIKLQESQWESQQREEVKRLSQQKPRVNTADLKTKEKELEQLEIRRGKLISKHSEATTKYRLYQGQLNDLKQLSDKCPVCGSVVSAEHLKREQAKLLQQVSKFSKESDDWSRQANYTESRIISLRSEIVDLRNLIKHREEYETKLRQLADQSNPYTQQRKQIQSEAFRLRMRISTLKKQIEELKKEHHATDFWVKGFKEVRLLIVDSVITQLEAEVNQTIYELGLPSWRVKFDVERETKSGSIRRGFTTMVFSPENEEPVPWEVWSGGESQRLRLAGATGFANLVFAMTGQQSNYELWDEPSTWLNEAGMHQMLEVLNERARQTNRTILIADHRALDYGGFSKRVQVIKDADGSRIKGI